MKRSRFTEEQIAFALKQQELGTGVEEICRKLGIAQATFFLKEALFSPWTVRATEAALGRGREHEVQEARRELEPDTCGLYLGWMRSAN